MTLASETIDPILARLIALVQSDPDALGLILGGSRGAGCADEQSDYDLQWVLTNEAYHERTAQGQSGPDVSALPGEPKLDVGYTCPDELARNAREPGWWTPGIATSRVVLDKTGEVTVAHQAMVRMPEEKAAADVPGWFDAYLNAFYRSMKAWRRSNELGGRMQCAESLMHLTKLLFTLERRWPPYHDRLRGQWALLAPQGWPPGYLHATFLHLLSTGDPALQQELSVQVQKLLRAGGHGGVIDAWEGEIERVMAFRFGEEESRGNADAVR